MSDQARVAEAMRALASPVAGGSLDAWRATAPALARDAVGVDSAALVVPKRAGFAFGAASFDPVRLAAYEHFFPLLSETGVVERGARDGVASRRALYGPHYDALMGSPYVQEFLASIRSFDALSVFVPLTRRVRTMEDAVQLTLSLGTRGRSVTERHLAIARLLQPALAVGVQSHGVLQEARDRLSEAIDGTGAACLVADRGGSVVHRTPALEALLAREPGREAVVAEAVRVGRSFWTAALVVQSTAVGRRGAYRLTATEVGDGADRFCVVRVERPETSAPTPADAAERLGLTPRQAEVAVLLAERMSNKEIAAALAVSVHTARHHVEAVLDRLGVRRADIAEALRAAPEGNDGPRL